MDVVTKKLRRELSLKYGARLQGDALEKFVTDATSVGDDLPTRLATAQRILDETFPSA